jgi:hypothetical protein
MALGLTETLTEISIRNSFWGERWGRRVRLTTSPPSVSQLCKISGIFEVSQTYGPPLPVVGTALLFFN